MCILNFHHCIRRVITAESLFYLARALFSILSSSFFCLCLYFFTRTSQIPLIRDRSQTGTSNLLSRPILLAVGHKRKKKKKTRLTALGQILMKLISDIHCPRRMNPMNFSHSLTFPEVPAHFKYFIYSTKHSNNYWIDCYTALYRCSFFADDELV